jgi:antitoxin VapB
VKTAKLFRNGRSQGVRLPQEFRFEGDHVFLKRVGDGVLILPAKRGWDALIRSLTNFPMTSWRSVGSPRSSAAPTHFDEDPT